MTAHTADEIVEAMARAIYETDPEGGFDPHDDRTFWRAKNSYWPDVVWNMWVRQARAAYAECLRRLREPTDSMMAVGDAAMDNDECDGPEDAWYAMIDARLKELG